MKFACAENYNITCTELCCTVIKMALASVLTLVDFSAVSKLLPKKDNHVGKVKIRKPQAKAKADSGMCKVYPIQTSLLTVSPR